MAAAQTYEEKKKTYMRVFWALLLITVVELAAARSPLPHTLKVLVVVGLSLTKAVVVAWFYMHLNHESRWTKIVAASPLVALIFVVALVYDSATDVHRRMDPYIGEPPRVIAPGHDPAERHAQEKQEMEQKKAAELDANFPDDLRSQTAEPAEAPSTPDAPATPQPPAVTIDEVERPEGTAADPEDRKLVPETLDTQGAVPPEGSPTPAENGE